MFGGEKDRSPEKFFYDPKVRPEVYRHPYAYYELYEKRDPYNKGAASTFWQNLQSSWEKCDGQIFPSEVIELFKDAKMKSEAYYERALPEYSLYDVWLEGLWWVMSDYREAHKPRPAKTKTIDQVRITAKNDQLLALVEEAVTMAEHWPENIEK